MFAPIASSRLRRARQQLQKEVEIMVADSGSYERALALLNEVLEGEPLPSPSLYFAPSLHTDFARPSLVSLTQLDPA